MIFISYPRAWIDEWMWNAGGCGESRQQFLRDMLSLIPKQSVSGEGEAGKETTDEPDCGLKNWQIADLKTQIKWWNVFNNKNINKQLDHTI